MKNVMKSACLFSSPHLDIYPVEFQRPFSEIDPDRGLGVLQERTPAESVRQTRLSNIGISYDYYLKNPRLSAVIVVVRGEFEGAVQVDNGAEILPRVVFYCHCSCSRSLDVKGGDIARASYANGFHTNEKTHGTRRMFGCFLFIFSFSSSCFFVK